MKAVIFDIGGVLELCPDRGWRTQWEQRLALPRGTINTRLAHLWRAGSVGKISQAEYESGVAQALDLTSAQLASVLDDGWAEYLGQPNEPLIRFFGELRPRHRTGIISNSFVGARERKEAHYGFSALCDAIIYSHEVGIEKPDHRIYRLGCDALDVSPAQVAFVDDVQENVDAARALGMHGVLFETNAQVIAALERFVA